ncbi:MAG: hypothetical protein QME21_05535 [Anaerolineales bacterium]|jgi:hypothetical protein|nr:hypothetical protein [Anaerolineales bacterium]
MEANLGRVINPEGAGKERTQLTRSVVLALRALVQQNEPNQETRDLAAYIALALFAIEETVDVSVQAWEKRGYWVKADRYRMEWAWSSKLGKAMKDAVLREDWAYIALTAAQVAERLKDVEVPKRHQLGAPWVGARQRLSP